MSWTVVSVCSITGVNKEAVAIALLTQWRNALRTAIAWGDMSKRIVQ